MLVRRSRLKIAAFSLLRGLPPALVARLRADEAPELNARCTTRIFRTPRCRGGPGSSAPGQAPCKAGRDARGRFAAPPPPVLRGQQAELARAHAEAAALAPWKAALARARMIKRLMKSQDRAARRAKPGRGPLHGLPPGTCPGGGTVRPDGKACEGSDTNSMNSGAGGGTAGARAEIPAAAVAPKDGAAGENSDTNSMNSGAGGGTAASEAILAALPNRAARRRWKSLRRRAHRGPAACSQQ